jgi:phenylpyruvate tautomerase PptA (4-oxalocrotonate tautomerase family)
MATRVSRNVMASSVEFTQGNRKVLLSKNLLPLISGVISAVSERPIAAFGVRNSKAFNSAAISQGYRGADKILEAAKDTLNLATSKGILVQNGVSYGINGDFRAIAESVVDFVNNSEEFSVKEAKVSKAKGNGRKAGPRKTGEKAKKVVKFRVDEAGKLVRLTRGKPSPFWMIVEAPETAEGSEMSNDFKVVQQPADPAEKAVKSKGSASKAKVAKSKGISEEELSALVASQVTEITADLTGKVESLTSLVKSLIDKVNFQSNEIVKLSAKLDKLTASEPAKVAESKAKSSDSRKAKEDAKLAAMADLSEISEEMANIVTSL